MRNNLDKDFRSSRLDDCKHYELKLKIIVICCDEILRKKYDSFIVTLYDYYMSTQFMLK